MKATRFHFQWSADPSPVAFRTGVSLHSHTLHSKESLDFIYKLAQGCGVLRRVLRRAEARYQAHHGSDLDLLRGWWTPPLAPLDAYNVEANQIAALGLAPIVSLTDHDDIEAPMSLQAVDAARSVPISAEWTVPYGPTFFHLGVHNLAPRTARSWMQTLAEFTAKPETAWLYEILSALNAIPGALVVFNHPLWDEKGVGTDVHRQAAIEFLGQCGEFVHAVEVNGLRPWWENRLAIHLAKDWSKPVISGGDRHALEPNAMLNVTNATSFSEFSSEIRSGYSHVFLTSQYREGHGSRILHNIVDVLQPYENHGYGWREWPDRVFYQYDSGAVMSLREIFGDGLPAAVRVFDTLLRLAGNKPIRSAVRAASARAEHVAL